MAEEQSFTAAVQIAGINPYVDVPLGVKEALGGGAKISVLVKVTAMGAEEEQSSEASQARRLAKDAGRLKAIGRLTPEGWFRTTVIELRSSPPRLYLDTWMRKATDVDVGDYVRVILKADRNSRELPTPPELREALDGNERAKREWERLAPREDGHLAQRFTDILSR